MMLLMKSENQKIRILKKKLNLTNVRKRFITFMDMWVAIFLVHELSKLICSKYSIFQSEHLDVLIGVCSNHNY